MLEGIFSAQPGLKRRINCTFEIDGYTPEGLSKIFIKQLNKDNWKLEDNLIAMYSIKKRNNVVEEKCKIVEFFEKRMNYFEAFGGDTLRLMKECKEIYSDDIFHKIFDIKDRNIESKDLDFIITEQQLNQAYDIYFKNRIQTAIEKTIFSYPINIIGIYSQCPVLFAWRN